jgi:hypothetical protein
MRVGQFHCHDAPEYWLQLCSGVMFDYRRVSGEYQVANRIVADLLEGEDPETQVCFRLRQGPSLGTRCS